MPLHVATAASPQPAVASPQPTPRRDVTPGLDAPRYEKSDGGRGGAPAHHAQLARRGTLPQWELGRALEMGRTLEMGHSAGTHVGGLELGRTLAEATL